MGKKIGEYSLFEYIIITMVIFMAVLGISAMFSRIIQ
jgi:hypothetical protein